MNTIKLKTYNYYPDFNNENLKNRAINIINAIKNKTAIGYENFGFHELALNFNQSNVIEIEEFVQKFLDYQIEDLIVFSNSQSIDNFKMGENFLFENDLLKNSKINCHFFNNDGSINFWFEQLEEIKHLLAKETTAFLFASLTPFNSAFLNFLKYCCNIYQQNIGYYRALEKMFIVAKEEVEEQLINLKIEENNVLIVPNILHNHFAFFSKINLILLLTKGANISDLLEGYSIASQDFTSKDITINIAFQLGYINAELVKDNKIKFLIGASKNLEQSLLNISKLKNQLYLNNNIYTSYAIFPEDIYTYGQYLIDTNYHNNVTFFQIINEKTDFLISDEINLKDMNFKIKNNKLSEYSYQVNKSLINTLSNIASLPVSKITLTDNSEVTLGKFVALIYWEFIYQTYLLKTNPFNFKESYE
ncbi:hypothetical protein [Mycoplasmopsis columbina]|uniref:Glucose-6-phosphate isomerase n=1 Tax=Mycoplasmopsis columbina SF7 TaxID=1037410 RepID=F9UJT0_9BACT|nr:hypothetical protein [Mycoplasmopsis columbina]EGV00276.1 glucose-6-phosphate isomerase [Mycoplasmopsis columbina SF7]VEU76860.1 Glucose-6-phosphate isomerase B [Mycoplasmopsis columbina]